MDGDLSHYNLAFHFYFLEGDFLGVGVGLR